VIEPVELGGCLNAKILANQLAEIRRAGIFRLISRTGAARPPDGASHNCTKAAPWKLVNPSTRMRRPGWI
jgi:hypothetical protein